MVDNNAKKRQKKCYLSEEDVCNLLLKYSATQVLTLLREVSQLQDAKIDWDALVRKTATGIENAREYQMLWRHLAYRQPLVERVEPGVQPLDDDSDLEYEVEVSPPVSTELVMEAANCVKVLASGSPNESTMPNSSAVDGEMPNGHSSKISSEYSHPASLLHNSSVTHPVSLQKQPQLVGISGDGMDVTNNNYPSRRKRKPWTEEEDIELIAAVRKYGEGNWATIVKGEYNWERTPSQLSQRWAIIRKRPGSLNIGGINAAAGSQLTEQQLATRHALDMALKDTSTAVGNGTAGTSNPTNASAANTDLPAPNNAAPSQVQPVINTASAKPAPPVPRPLIKKAPAKPSVTVDSIQAAAVAAGARIASPSDAATLIKAAQTKKAVHIRGGATLIKSSTAGSTGSLPPNVHFIRTGLAAAPTTTIAKGSVSVKPFVSQLSRAKTAHVAASSFANELRQMEDKISAEVKVPGTKPMIDIQEDRAEKGQLTSLKAEVDCTKQIDVDNSQCVMNTDTTEHKDEVCGNATEKPVPKIDNEKTSNVHRNGDQSANVKLEVLPSVVDGDSKKMEVSSASMS